MNHRRLSTKTIFNRLFNLFKKPVFILLTIWGNGFVLLAAALFYFFERGVNSTVTSFLDCLAWAVGMVTTIGFGPIVPVTVIGKIISIFVMIVGALFLWTYMALFVSALVSPEITSVESEIKEIETDISQLQKEINIDEKSVEQLARLVFELNGILKKIKK